jgi:hypothetical protein
MRVLGSMSISYFGNILTIVKDLPFALSITCFFQALDLLAPQKNLFTRVMRLFILSEMNKEHMKPFKNFKN